MWLASFSLELKMKAKYKALKVNIPVGQFVCILFLRDGSCRVVAMSVHLLVLRGLSWTCRAFTVERSEVLDRLYNPC